MLVLTATAAVDPLCREERAREEREMKGKEGNEDVFEEEGGCGCSHKEGGRSICLGF